MISQPEQLLAGVRGIHRAIRERVRAACAAQSIDALSAIVAEDCSDTQFAIDRLTEETLLGHFEALSRTWPLVLIAEGLDPAGVTLPTGTRPQDVVIRCIVDPIDGTRGLMYQKRPAWVLTGVAPNRGPATKLADIELAVQTELPLVKQHLADELWAVRGGGAHGERVNLLTGETAALRVAPSQVQTLSQGFGGIARHFPGDIGELAAIEDDVVLAVLGPKQPGKAHTFSDQYPSTAGQLYELFIGHDRWGADLRPLLGKRLHGQGQNLGICCHPYDICTELIAREAGAIVTGVDGTPLAAPLDTTTPVAWVGYANATLRGKVEPALAAVLRRRGLV